MSGKSNEALNAMIEQGFSCLRTGAFEEAIVAFSTAHTLESQDDRPLRGRGLASLQLGDTVSGENDFRRARQLNSDEPENWMGLGLSLAMQNKIYDALKVYEDLLVLSPNLVTGHIQLGRLQLKVGAISKGRDILNKALTLRPNLEQRRAIEAMLKEQDKLDKNRYYRPDFDRLKKLQQPSILADYLKKAVGFFKKKDNTPAPSSHT